jgi:glycerate kinase
MGKLPMGILGNAEGTPVSLIAGRVNDRELLLQAGFAHVECINPADIALAEAMRKEVAQRNISRTVAALIRIH